MKTARKHKNKSEEHLQSFLRKQNHALVLQSFTGINTGKKYTQTEKKKFIKRQRYKIQNPPPPQKIMHKGHEYVLASSLKKSTQTSSKYNEDAEIMRNHQLLQEAKLFISSNSFNPWGNERR